MKATQPPNNFQQPLAERYVPADFVPLDLAQRDRSIAWWVEHTVERLRDHVILKSGMDEVTYAQLNERANRLAHFILNGPAAQSEVIAIWLPQGKHALIAMLGIIKAGKAYTAFDPMLPPARVQLLLESTDAGLLLTNAAHLAAADEAAAGHCPVVDVAAIQSGPTTNPGIYTGPDAMICILFTSGSTGQPKGVIYTQGNMVFSTITGINKGGIAPSDRIPWLSAPSVAGSAAALVMPLFAGVRLYPAEMRRGDLPGLAKLLAAERITIYGSTPTLFRQLVSAMPENISFPHMRSVSMGGEPVRRSDVEFWRHHFPRGCQLTNGFASTEVGSACTYVIDHDTPLTEELVPIGHPSPDKEILLLDEDGNEVADGETGEIAVRSRYLAAGYWRMPELTAARFRRDPADSKLVTFITGDLARRRTDGVLMHMGRKDDQVKVRGFRIEVAEVEVALLTAAGVREAVVTVRPDVRGENRLIAYIVPKATPPASVSMLRQTVAQQLPDYMIPSAFVFVDSLPQATSGKVVRRLLPDPGTARPELAATYVAPRTTIEQSLAHIWGDVLQLDQIGINDPFLELGGHSIQAARIIAQVLVELRIDLPVQTLFDTPTVATMAAVIAEHQASQIGSDRLEELLRGLEALPEDEASLLLAQVAGSAE